MVTSAFGAGFLAATAIVPGAPAQLGMARTASSYVAADTFSRSVSNGLGNATVGGAWKLLGASKGFSVADDAAHLTASEPGTGVSASLPDVTTRDSSTYAAVAVDGAVTGGGTYFSVTARQVADYTYYGLRTRMLPNGSVTASIVSRTPDAEQTLATQVVDGLDARDGTQVWTRLMVSGASPTTVTAKVWANGDSEPGDWTISATDSTDALQTAGDAGMAAYASASADGGHLPTILVHKFEVTSNDSEAQAAPAPPTSANSARPGSTNTGVPDGTKLTPYWGDLTITTPGATYDSLDVHGFVRIQAPDVTIRRSLIRGGNATGNIGLVTNYGQPNFTIEDSTLTPDHPSVWIDGIKGNNFIARRVEAYGTVDTAKIHGDNVRIENSWFHDTKYYSSDPNQGGGPTHNDGVQILGGNNIAVIGNNISVPIDQNSAIQVTQNYDWVSNTIISRNWLDGAGCTVNVNDLPRTSLRGLALSNNRFGRNHRYIDCAVIAYPGVSMSISDNVWDDNGLPVRVRLNG